MPLVSRVGGLVDTVVDIDAHPAEGTGITFPPTAEGLAAGLERARVLFADKAAYAAVQDRGMTRDFSWQKAALAYEQLYESSL